MAATRVREEERDFRQKVIDSLLGNPPNVRTAGRRLLAAASLTFLLYYFNVEIREFPLLGLTFSADAGEISRRTLATVTLYYSLSYIAEIAVHWLHSKEETLSGARAELISGEDETEVLSNAQRNELIRQNRAELQRVSARRNWVEGTISALRGLGIVFVFFLAFSSVLSEEKSTFLLYVKQIGESLHKIEADHGKPNTRIR